MYESQRGKKSQHRPYKNIPDAERRDILVELQTTPMKVICRLHRINRQTVAHIRFHCKHLLNGVDKTPKNEVHMLKHQGYNSGQVAQMLSLPVSVVNKIWV